MLLPTRCPICATPGPAPCLTCRGRLQPAPPLPPPPGLDGFAALFVYAGAGRELIARLKYRNARSALPWLAAGMAALARGSGAEVVTFVPTSRHRRRWRGYDQARLLARAVAANLGLPCVPLLHRAPGPPQTGRSLAERRHGPRFWAPPGAPRPERVLLVDDVLTTGATLAAAATALRSRGVGRVEGLAAGRTPLKVLASGTETDEDDGPVRLVLARGPPFLAPAGARRPSSTVAGGACLESAGVGGGGGHDRTATVGAAYTAQWAACGFVVASRCQSQAKRPT